MGWRGDPARENGTQNARPILTVNWRAWGRQKTPWRQRARKAAAGERRTLAAYTERSGGGKGMNDGKSGCRRL